MKTLEIIGNNAQFKIDETGTLIPFKAFDGNNQALITNTDTAIFNIKNNTGLVKSVTAKITNAGYIPCLNTADLTELPPDTYECELWITNDKKLVNIYPDTGFVSFTINQNSTLQKGETIAVTTIADFKKQLDDEVWKTTQQATDNLNQEFTNLKQANDEYIKQHAIQGPKGDTGSQGPVGPKGPQGEQGPKGTDGVTPTVSVGKVNTVSSSTPASVTNSGSGSNVVLDFNVPKGEQGPKGADFNLTWTDKGNLPKSNEKSGGSSWIRLLLSNNFMYLHGWLSNGRDNKGSLTFTIDADIVHKISNTGVLFTGIASDDDYFNATATGGTLKLDVASGQVTINSATSNGGYRVDWLIPLFNIDLP